MNLYKIMVVDDDKKVLKFLKDFLELENYTVVTAESGDAALKKMSVAPDLILLDINMPRMNGLEFCKRIRNHVSCPIIFLTARIEDEDKIIGLKSGGDDYIIKPFNLDELLARIEAHLRRENRNIGKKKLLFSDELCIDYSGKKVIYHDVELDFTRAEFDLIEVLSSYPGQVFDKELLYEKAWGYEKEGDSHLVTEMISRIRKKLKKITNKVYIETVWGYGYKWIG
ncbi:response regulator transcription factor [bacterium]|uniref:response regulator transcription factor n=1 Tax=Agathobacter rectalis TaxID=39491 RepID=UPI0027D31EE9|nr:response regulator transcription factor [Agathobacter rectalis]MCB6950240.1 response regulator transcription factor [Agathobacter rectalis]MCI6044566.1 response regulator transcription factor [bacterium]MDY3022556.1 response regulator transcription factor [Oliverpabstia sp.]MDY3999607.1 response regulator transcription factor [Blautia sp.]